MAAVYKLEVVTPERVMLSENVVSAIAPGADGVLGILAGHAPLMTELVPGDIIVVFADNRTTSHIVISGGFMEVSGSRTTILADSAERADEIDITRAEADLIAARRMLAETSVGSEQAAAAKQAIAHAEYRVRAAQNR